jgi:hypothetical protein
MDGTEIKPINTIDSTAVEVELTVEQPATPKRKSSRWRSMSSVITHSTAISEDTKRIMDAFHALDDLTVEPEQGHIWKDHGYRLVALVVVLPSVASAAWMAIPLNPWKEETWGEKQINMYIIFSAIYTFFLGLGATQFFNAIMPLTRCIQVVMAVTVSVTVIVGAFISGLVVGKYLFPNCVLAAVAWDSFSFIGLCISFLWVARIFYLLINRAKTEVAAVLKNATNYKELYGHTTGKIAKENHYHAHLADVSSALHRSLHVALVDHHEETVTVGNAGGDSDSTGDEKNNQTSDVDKSKEPKAKAMESLKSTLEKITAVDAEEESLSVALRLQIADRLSKIADDFSSQKHWQFGMTVLVIFICCLTYWMLTVFVAWWASGSHDPIVKGWQTIVYYLAIFVMEWLAMLCADLIDVAQITTATPGALRAEHSRKFDDFQFYRLSTRVMFYFSCVRRAFYIPLFCQIANWEEWVAMTLVSMVACFSLQVLVRSQSYYDYMKWYTFKCWPDWEYRSKDTCLDQSCLYNGFDFINLCTCLFQFLVVWALTDEHNMQSFSYLRESSSETVVYVIVWASFQMLYCAMVSFYEWKVHSKEGNERLAGKLLEKVYSTGDSLVFSMVIIGINVTQNPYFAFSLNNLSEVPCTDLYKNESIVNVTAS